MVFAQAARQAPACHRRGRAISRRVRPRRWGDAGPLGRQSVTAAQKAGVEVWSRAFPDPGRVAGLILGSRRAEGATFSIVRDQRFSARRRLGTRTMTKDGTPFEVLFVCPRDALRLLPSGASEASAGQSFSVPSDLGASPRAPLQFVRRIEALYYAAMSTTLTPRTLARWDGLHLVLDLVLVEEHLVRLTAGVEKLDGLALAGAGDALDISATIKWKGSALESRWRSPNSRLRHRHLGFRMRKLRVYGGLPVPRAAVEAILDVHRQRSHHGVSRQGDRRGRSQEMAAARARPHHRHRPVDRELAPPVVRRRRVA